MKTHIDNTIEEIKKEFDQIVQDLCDWNYGTVYKEYDREEEVEVLEEDTKEYAEKLWKLFEQRLTEVQAEAKRYADKRVKQFVDVLLYRTGFVIEGLDTEEKITAMEIVGRNLTNIILTAHKAFINQNTESEEDEISLLTKIKKGINNDE